MRKSFAWICFAGGMVLEVLPVSAHAAQLPPRAAGLWQSTTTVTGADGQPLPNGSNIVTVSCVDPATDLKFFLSGAHECSQLTIAGAGQQYTIDGACTHHGKPVTVHETLLYASPQAVTLTASVQTSSGPVSVTSQMQWQGACLAGMTPGDEGVISNGTFAKSDNINDPNNQ